MWSRCFSLPQQSNQRASPSSDILGFAVSSIAVDVYIRSKSRFVPGHRRFGKHFLWFSGYDCHFDSEHGGCIIVTTRETAFSFHVSPKALAVAKASKKSDSAKRSGKPKLAAIDQKIASLVKLRKAWIQAQVAKQNDPSEIVRASLLSVDNTVASLKHDGSVDTESLGNLLKHVASVTHLGLHTERVAFLGPQYSFSHLAAVKYFGERHPLMPVPTIAAVFEAVVRHDVRLGLAPIENTTDGRVVDTLGMFIRNPVRICGEVLLPIHHYLLGKCKREEVCEVYSKPQALSQCRRWLATQLPQARLVEMSSTAAAAQLAMDKPGAAAIASLEAGRAAGLEVIDERIEDNPNNVTRFAVLGDREPPRSGNDKTSLLFQVPHEPGALADSMVIFKRNQLNLTWIESFPLPGVDGEYLFFAELEGHQRDKAVANALEQLQKRALRLDILGSYPRGKI